MTDKSFFIVLLVSACIFSCKKDNSNIVKNYENYFNQYDTLNLNKIISSDFSIKSNPFLGHIFNIDSIKAVAGHIQMTEITNQDSIIKTKEVWTSKFDSLLGIKSILKFRNTYTIRDGNVQTIRTDSIENLKQYYLERKNKRREFDLYINLEYNSLKQEEKVRRILEILTKYNQLSDSERERIYIRSYLKDSKFVSNNNWIGMGLHFKGNSTVLVSAMGMSVGTTYSIDGNQIRVDPTPGSMPMPLEIKDQNTMIGQSIQGEYIFKRVVRR